MQADQDDSGEEQRQLRAVRHRAAQVMQAAIRERVNHTFPNMPEAYETILFQAEIAKLGRKEPTDMLRQGIEEIQDVYGLSAEQATPIARDAMIELARAHAEAHDQDELMAQIQDIIGSKRVFPKRGEWRNGR